MTEAYRTAHVSRIQPPVPPDAGSYEWKPVRHHFGIGSFGVNAFVAHAKGDWVVEEHDEMQSNAAQHEELYMVTRGRARFTVAGDEVDAPEGTFVYVGDPRTRRGAKALEPGTTVLAIGGKPGEVFAVSQWEAKYF